MNDFSLISRCAGGFLWGKKKFHLSFHVIGRHLRSDGHLVCWQWFSFEFKVRELSEIREQFNQQLKKRQLSFITF